jgi:hypothetical protein
MSGKSRVLKRPQFIGAVLSFAGVLLAILFVTSGQIKHQEQAVVPISKSELERVAAKRVVFAHQSVGENILSGVRRLAKEKQVSLNIVEIRQPPSSGAGIFHFKVGRNGAPLEKISDYVSAVNGETFTGIDIALMKLCYVDINTESDAQAIAKAYTDAVKALQAKHPGTRFVAMTAPLRAGAGFFKKILGRGSKGLAENAKRLEFNTYLRQNFDAAHLFDIAKLEAEEVKVDGKSIEVLRTSLTDDGGHLNADGQHLVGAAFLKFLASYTGSH